MSPGAVLNLGARPQWQGPVSESSGGAHHRETQFPDDLHEVLVPLPDLGLPRGEVAADEAEAGRVEQQADGDRSLVSGRTPHPCLHSVHRNVPVTENPGPDPTFRQVLVRKTPGTRVRN